jgi:hypothetical protein
VLNKEPEYTPPEEEPIRSETQNFEAVIEEKTEEKFEINYNTATFD